MEEQNNNDNEPLKPTFSMPPESQTDEVNKTDSYKFKRNVIIILIIIGIILIAIALIIIIRYYLFNYIEVKYSIENPGNETLLFSGGGFSQSSHDGLFVSVIHTAGSVLSFS